MIMMHLSGANTTANCDVQKGAQVNLRYMVAMLRMKVIYDHHLKEVQHSAGHDLSQPIDNIHSQPYFVSQSAICV